MTRISPMLRLRIAFARAARWEFWPGWLFYLPIIVYINWRGLVFTRPVSAFTAINPGMSRAGGLIGEAKTETLLPLQNALPERVARFARIEPAMPAQRFAAIKAFQSQLETAWPLVLKPDVSERGRGVRLAWSDEAIRDYVQRFHRPLLAQAFAPGEEFGLFYIRGDGLVSLTEKQFPQVVGDGQHTLAELILKDARAYLVAPLLFERFDKQLDDVIPAGQSVALADVGSHCRGSTFLNAERLRTPELEAAVQAIVEALPGFDFGRLDVRATSAEALARGEGFKVIEVNGASSEPAHVYHPGTPYLTGLRTFCRAWRRMCQLGEANVEAGAAYLKPSELAALAWREAGLRRGIDWPENIWHGDDAVRFSHDNT